MSDYDPGSDGSLQELWVRKLKEDPSLHRFREEFSEFWENWIAVERMLNIHNSFISPRLEAAWKKYVGEGGNPPPSASFLPARYPQMRLPEFKESWKPLVVEKSFDRLEEAAGDTSSPEKVTREPDLLKGNVGFSSSGVVVGKGITYEPPTTGAETASYRGDLWYTRRRSFGPLIHWNRIQARLPFSVTTATSRGVTVVSSVQFLAVEPELRANRLDDGTSINLHFTLFVPDPVAAEQPIKMGVGWRCKESRKSDVAGTFFLHLLNEQWWLTSEDSRSGKYFK